MHKLDCRKTYWDSVAAKKTFTHTIQVDKFREQVALREKILDYGCGYGRTCAKLIRTHPISKIALRTDRFYKLKILKYE
jgi:hypothetical protein